MEGCEDLINGSFDGILDASKVKIAITLYLIKANNKNVLIHIPKSFFKTSSSKFFTHENICLKFKCIIHHTKIEVSHAIFKKWTETASSWMHSDYRGGSMHFVFTICELSACTSFYSVTYLVSLCVWRQIHVTVSRYSR